MPNHCFCITGDSYEPEAMELIQDPNDWFEDHCSYDDYLTDYYSDLAEAYQQTSDDEDVFPHHP